MKYSFTPEEIESAFSRLAEVLKDQPLRSEGGGTRKIKAGEFMLMHSSDEMDLLAFKHIDTRNYVFVCRQDALMQKARVDILQVPCSGQPFKLGYF